MSEVKQMVREIPPRKKEAESTANEKETEETAIISEMEEAFDRARCQEVLEDIIQNFKDKNKNMETAVIKQPFEIIGQKIIFLLNGEIQKDIFLKLKPELISLLRQSLKNSKAEISFQIKGDEVSGSKRLYTSTEKLRYLREKSPALKELQRRFGLETDF